MPARWSKDGVDFVLHSPSTKKPCGIDSYCIAEAYFKGPQGEKCGIWVIINGTDLIQAQTDSEEVTIIDATDKAQEIIPKMIEAVKINPQPDEIALFHYTGRLIGWEKRNALGIP